MVFKCPRNTILKIVDFPHISMYAQHLSYFMAINSIQDLKIAAEWLENAGAIIAVVLNSESRWWIEDGAAAVENMLIAATALGYGSCWLEGYTRQREYEFKNLLNVPENRRLFSLVPVGVPIEWPEKD